MATQNKEVQVCGHTFQLRGYTWASFEDFTDVLEEVEAEKEEGEINDFEYYSRLLKVVLEGPTEKIDPKSVEGRHAEEVIMSFLPESKQTAARLIGF